MIGFYILIGLLVGLTLCILYSALVVASRCDEEEEKEEERLSHNSK